jgi:Domain of Unknown Function (DUF1080)
MIGIAALAALIAPPAAAAPRTRCGDQPRGERGYTVIFDGTGTCFKRWRYAGGSSVSLQRDGTLRTGSGPANLGVLWYAARRYRDFSLRLQFRADSPLANSGVHLRFPAPRPPVRGCPTPQAPNPAAWIAVNCGHEVQINDSPDGPPNDPRKTGSIYGFADLDATQARVTPAGRWNDLEIRVVGQTYTVRRNGVRINRYVTTSSARKRIGRIGLQGHGGPQDVVSFRNVRVRALG